MKNGLTGLMVFLSLSACDSQVSVNTTTTDAVAPSPTPSADPGIAAVDPAPTPTPIPTPTTVSLSNIADVNVNEAQVTTVTPTFSSSGGTVVFSCVGCPAFITVNSSTGAAVISPTYGDAGTYALTVKATISTHTSSASFNVVVAHVNRLPVFGALATSQNASEGTLFSLSIPVTDADGDTITLSMQGAPAGATLSSGVFAWTPPYSAANTSGGVYSVTFTASDGIGAPVTKNISITVADVHVPPVFGAIGNQTGTENSAMSFSVSATDVDLYPVAISATGLPAGSAFNGSTFSWTPSCTARGDYTVTFTATDGTLSTNQNVAIHVNHFNCSPPQWDSNYIRLAAAGANVDLSIRQISASDPYDSATSIVVQYEHQWFDCFNQNIVTLGTITPDVTPHYNTPGYPALDNGQTIRVNLSGPNLTNDMWFLFSASDQDGSKIYAWFRFNRNNDGTTFTIHPWITQGASFNTTGFCGGAGFMHSN